MKAQVNSINQSLTTWSARLLKVLGLTAVAVILFTVVDAKFDHLRQLNSRMPEHIITAEQRMKELDCLTRNIYWEAASEPFEGKVGVAQVTLNRAESGRFPPDICNVVYQKNVIYGRVICQFSWYCESGPKVRSNAHYKESMEVAKKVLLENFRLPSMHKAMYYHADYVSPNWNLPKISQIGRHIFYGEKNGKI